jgi:GDPmannose 4,6-dehydratase
MSTCLITRATGQEGAYLSHLPRVVGMMRRSASPDLAWVRSQFLGILDNIDSVNSNLAKRASWNQPLLTGHITGLSAAKVLEAGPIAQPYARFYQASSSEMSGTVQAPRQSETPPLYPRSPYAAARGLSRELPLGGATKSATSTRDVTSWTYAMFVLPILHASTIGLR